MRVRIHRGTQEIGGNCVEIEAGGCRIVLDLGRPLWADDTSDVPLPGVAGLADGTDTSLLGVVLSHPHLDHYGLVSRIAPGLPVFIGEAAARILEEASFFSHSAVRLQPRGFLRDRAPFDLGPFHVTPFLVDHSAYDAYSLLIEAEGRAIFYTGDFRGHGRKAGLFRKLLAAPPRPIDVLLTEGTHVRSTADGMPVPKTEQAVEEDLVRHFNMTSGMALVACSAQNIDRLVTVYRAAVQSNRDLIVDLYAATVAAATGNPRIPQLRHDRLKVIVPLNQRITVKNSGEFGRVHAIRAVRIYAEQLAENPRASVLLFRTSLIRDIERAACLSGAAMFWSLWDGYLREDSALPLKAFLDRHRIPLKVVHTSGHASIHDLQLLAQALQPQVIVPMHTEAPGRFPDLFPRVELHQDGEWWEVAP